MVRKISQTQSLLINAATSDIREVAHAAEVIIEAMPNLAIAYGALIDGEWRKFPTRCFLAAVGLERLEFDELTYRDLANTFDMELMNQWASKPEIERTEPLVFLASNGKQISRWLELHLSRVGDVSGANFYILRDVDVEVRLEKQNQKNAKKQDAQLGALTSALNASRNGFAIWKAERDSSGNISTFTLVFINDTGAAPTGKMPRQLMGDNITRVLGEDQSRDLAVLFTQALDEHSTVSEVVQLNSPTGWVGAYLNEVVPMGDDQVLASFRDVSDDQRERDRLNWLAQHDHLTGLPNRRNLEDILEKSLENVRGKGAFVAFAFVDIDDFKNVNDQHGHDVGDELLKAFAQRMRQSLGDVGVVARLAGDEFAVVMDSIDSAEHLKDSCDKLMTAMHRPFNDLSPAISVTCSAGIAICAGDEPITEVLRIADKAMYRAKHDGKNRYNVVHI